MSDSNPNPLEPMAPRPDQHPPRIPTTMHAAVQDRYGSAADVVRVDTIPVPEPASAEVLVQVRASSVNPLDWHVMTGTPYMVRAVFGLRRPKRKVLGSDLAGRIVAVGRDVDDWAVGDEVWGWTRGGAFAEYCVVPATKLVRKPPAITFEQGGSIAVAAFTALQALRDQVAVQPGDRVLINGAAGGVGTFAVQIAKHHGAHVVGVCSGRNVDMVRRLGADDVIDYEVADFVDHGPFDVIVDVVGSRDADAIIAALAPGGRHVLISGPKANAWFGPMLWIERTKRKINKAGRRSTSFTAAEKLEDAEVINELIESGAVAPEVAHRFALADVVEAMDLLATNHARAKIAVTL